jgi:TolB protein
VAGETVDQLQDFGAEPPLTLATVSDRPVEFAWSPAGDQIAYAIQEEIEEPAFGPIHIFDLKTGQSSRLTDLGFRIRAFFWSPDGQRLGYLTKLSLRDSEWLQWRVYDLTRNEDRGFKAFFPSFQMRFVLGSFNQFAQSHRLWSPDGRYLVYADRDRDLVERIWLIDTQSDDGHNTTPVAEGSMGFWSWE